MGSGEGARSVVLVEDVQAFILIVAAGFVVGESDLAGGLAEQSFFLDTLLLALSGLAAASVEAGLFVRGNHAQLVSEAALIAGMTGGAVNA